MSDTSYLFTTTKYAVVALAVPLSLLLAAGSYFTLLAVYRMVTLHVTGTDTYAHMPRPEHKTPRSALLFGHLGEFRKTQPVDAYLQWSKEVDSNVYVYRTLFYEPRVWLSDPKALHYILGSTNSYDFPKSTVVQQFLKTLLGEGLLVVQGDAHKRQRKIIQPAFNVSAIRDLTPIFFKHAIRLTQILTEFTDRATESDTPQIALQSVQSAKVSRKGAPVLDMGTWLSRTTLDIIGEAAFAYKFGSAEDELKGAVSKNELAWATGTMSKAASNVSLLQFGQTYLSGLPGLGWVKHIPNKRQANINRAYEVLQRVAQKIIDEKRAVIEAEMRGGDGAEKESASFKKAQLEEAGLDGTKDLLHLMMKANLATDVKESEKMSDAELLGQLTTIILAGHGTTQAQLSWVLWVLSSRPAMQDKLRAELVEYFAGRDELDYDSLNALPYLDNVCKEIMRFISPVVQSNRVVSKDCVVPLSRPYERRDGKGTFSSVPLLKGSSLVIPIQFLNRSEDMWGPTANEFDPERWNDVPRRAKEAGFPLHLLTFTEGPRGCIGNRLAITEFKAILATLLQKLRFEEVEGWEVVPKHGIVVRPTIKGQEDLGLQMPLRISRVKSA